MELHTQQKSRKLRRKHNDSETTASPALQQGHVDHVLHLQRTIGNKATQQVLQRDTPETSTESPQALLEKGANLANSHNFEDAIDLFEQALQDKTITPVQKAKIYYDLGVCYLKQDDTMEALDYFGKVVAMGEIDANVYKAALHGLRKARAYVNEDYDPEDIYQEGVEAFESNDYQAAIEKFSLALNMFDKLPALLKSKAMYNLGAGYYRLSKYRQALSKFEEVLALGNLEPEVLKAAQKGIRKAKMKLGLLHGHGKAHARPIIF